MKSLVKQSSQQKQLNGQAKSKSSSKKRTKTEDIKASELKYRMLFETAQDGILLVDAETGKITDVNPYLLLMLSYSREDVVGKSLWELSPLKDAVASKVAFLELQRRKFIRYDNLPLETKDGKPFYVEFISNVYEVQGKPVVQCNIRDNTERVLAEKKAVFISNHDTLTQLYNRTYFDEELHRLEKSRNYPISIFMLDVDGLKAVNDNFGHQAGDNLLKRAAQVLKSCFRDEDIIARIGGDEFAVLLANTSRQAAENIKLRMERTLRLHNHDFPGQPLSLSIGAATLDEQGSLDEVLKTADEMMYRHKRAKIGISKNGIAEQMDLLNE